MGRRAARRRHEWPRRRDGWGSTGTRLAQAQATAVHHASVDVLHGPLAYGADAQRSSGRVCARGRFVELPEGVVELLIVPLVG
jgi:hypothetical protein